MTAVVRKFIKINPVRGTEPYGKQIRAQTIAYNRLGGTLTGIGQNLANITNMMEFQNEFLTESFLKKKKEDKEEVDKQLDERLEIAEDTEREENFKEDQLAEEAQEVDEDEENKEGLEEAKKAPKKKFSWMEAFLKPFAPLFGFLKATVGTFIKYKFLKWVGDPKNQKTMKVFFSFMKSLFKMVFGLVKFGSNQIMTGIGNVFGNKEPGQSHLDKAFEGMFGILRIIGGMASFWLASRMLMPWKLLSDINAMRTIGVALTAGESAGGGPGMGNRRNPNKPKGRNYKSLADRLRSTRRKLQIATEKFKRGLGNKINQAKNLGKNIWKTGKNLFQKGMKLFQSKPGTGGGWFKGLKGNIASMWKNVSGKAGDAWNFIGNQGKKFLTWADDFGKQMLKNVGDVIGGIKEKAATWAKKIGDIAELAKNPAKLVDKVKGLLQGKMDKLLKQNKTMAKLLELGKDPKKIKDAIKGMMEGAKTNKNLLKLQKGLTNAKAMKIQGLDAIIAAILGVINYTLLGESPINALVNALSGLVGYTAGFAIGAPFGGAPGFITGMAGAWVGEQIGKVILSGLAKTGLDKITDPIMGDRPLVRDPFGGGDSGGEGDGEKSDLELQLEREDAEDRELMLHPYDRRNVDVSAFGGEEGKLYTLRELLTMEQEGVDFAIAYLEARRGALKDMKESGMGSEGSYTWSSRTEMTNEKGETIVVTDSYDSKKMIGGLVPFVKDIKTFKDNKIMNWMKEEGGEFIRNAFETGKEGLKQLVTGDMEGLRETTSNVSEKLGGFAINIKEIVASKLEKVNKPTTVKKTNTNTQIIVARQQVLVNKGITKAPRKVVYASTPTMVNRQMRV